VRAQATLHVSDGAHTKEVDLQRSWNVRRPIELNPRDGTDVFPVLVRRTRDTPGPNRAWGLSSRPGSLPRFNIAGICR
jgi:hypothetical protein